MNVLSRRQFLAQLIALPSAAIAVRRALAVSSDAPFEFLVVGDSLVWGQGLDEKDKFYTLTKNWLETEAFGRTIPVNLKVRAHSGSTLTFHENEAEAFRKSGKDERVYYNSEINVGFPSIRTQLDIAATEYESTESVKLIMLSGGITDISVAAILNPLGKNRQLRNDIEKYCGESMSEVLEHAATLFPNALIAVVGYYPMISPRTRTQDLFNFTLEAYGIPRSLKPVANNLLTKQFFKIFAKKAIKRSRIWVEMSESRIRRSIDGLNARLNKTRAVYVKAPIDETNTYGTKGSLVFRMLKKGRIEDRFYDERTQLCDPLLGELKTSTGLEYPVRFCEMAAVGHPNPDGSRLFAEAIIGEIAPLITRK